MCRRPLRFDDGTSTRVAEKADQRSTAAPFEALFRRRYLDARRGEAESIRLGQERAESVATRPENRGAPSSTADIRAGLDDDECSDEFEENGADVIDGIELEGLATPLGAKED